MLSVIRRRVLVAATSVVLIPLALGGCWAQSNDLSCSSDSAVETVKRLVRDAFTQGANAMQAMFMDFDHTEIAIQAIRTVRSTSRGAYCQASIRTNMAFKPGKEGQALAAIFRGRTETVRELAYRLQLTDDGKVYVTLSDHEATSGVSPQSQEDDD